MTQKLKSKQCVLCFLIIMLLILPSISFSQTSNNVTEVGQIAPIGEGLASIKTYGVQSTNQPVSNMD